MIETTKGFTEMISRKIRAAIAAAVLCTGVTLVPTQQAEAATCLNLKWTYIQGDYSYATVYNICSGAYRFRFIFADGQSVCHPIAGYATQSYLTGYWNDALAERLALC